MFDNNKLFLFLQGSVYFKGIYPSAPKLNFHYCNS